MSAVAGVTEAPAPASGVRSALRRLFSYIRRHPLYYTVWAVVTLAYVAGYVAIPQLAGSAIQAVVHPTLQWRPKQRGCHDQRKHRTGIFCGFVGAHVSGDTGLG